MAETRYQLPVWDTITTAWSKVHGAKLTFWKALGIYLLCIVGSIIVTAIIQAMSPLLGAIVNFLIQIFLTLLVYGLLYMGYQRAIDAPLDYTLLFRGTEVSRGIQLIGVMILTWLMVLPAVAISILVTAGIAMGGAQGSTILTLLTGLIYAVCIIIAVYLFARISLSALFVLDQNLGCWQAIKASFRATKGNTLQIILLYIIVLVIMILSSLPLLIGWIWALPLMYICAGLVYKRLKTSA